MSYPSITEILDNQGIQLDTASDKDLEGAFLQAFKADLSLGFAKVNELVEKLQEVGERAMITLDPNSDEGKQFARLLGADMARKVLERHFGVKFGFYNCCKGVVAKSSDDLQLNFREQIEAQSPGFVDC